MAISIDDFKKAFADKASGNGVKELLIKVGVSLKQLKAAVNQAAQEQQPAAGFDSVLKGLVQRYATASTKSVDASADVTAELDEILHQSETAINGIRAVAAKPGPAASTTGPVQQAAPPLAAPPPPITTSPPTTVPPTTTAPPTKPSPPVAPTKSKTLRTGVALVPDFKGLRTRLTDWVAKNISKDRARGIVNLSNLRDVHTDGILFEMTGAEILAFVKVGPAGTELEQFDLDRTFTPSTASWEAADGNIAAEIEVIDVGTGLPIKGAIARLPDGKPFATDADGVAKVELPADPESTVDVKVNVSATGYVSTSVRIFTSDRRWEGAVRMTPVNVAALDLSHVTITVIDITEGTPVPEAAVKVGNLPKTTDENGVVSLDLVPGEYALTITATDFVTETGKIDVRGGKKVVINETFGIKPLGSDDIYVRVLNSRSKKPLPNAVVRISSQQENTDDRGEARFLSMPFGEYRIGAQADGYKPSAETIKHNMKSGTAFREIKLEPAKP